MTVPNPFAGRSLVRTLESPLAPRRQVWPFGRSPPPPTIYKATWSVDAFNGANEGSVTLRTDTLTRISAELWTTSGLTIEGRAYTLFCYASPTQLIMIAQISMEWGLGLQVTGQTNFIVWPCPNPFDTGPQIWNPLFTSCAGSCDMMLITPWVNPPH